MFWINVKVRYVTFNQELAYVRTLTKYMCVLVHLLLPHLGLINQLHTLRRLRAVFPDSREMLCNGSTGGILWHGNQRESNYKKQASIPYFGCRKQQKAIP